MNNSSLNSLFDLGHEQVSFCHDAVSGYKAIVAIHSTKLGPAVGGTRFWNYSTIEEALIDVLRLARGMTYKNAAAGLPLGGGKAVIIGDNRTTDRETLFRSHGRFVESFHGRFITGEDVGTNPTDMQFASEETSHVAGFAGRGGDPSPWTARGTLRGIQASAKQRWGSDSLRGKTIALQGCGNVGSLLVALLHDAGARLIVADVDKERAATCARNYDAKLVSAEEIYEVAADIFAPCALGAILNDQTIPRLNVEIVAGAANNQLSAERHALDLEARGILYAPDFILNAGGIICGGAYLLNETQHQLEQRITKIYDTLLEVFDLAKRCRITSAAAAERYAESRLPIAMSVR